MAQCYFVHEDLDYTFLVPLSVPVKNVNFGKAEPSFDESRLFYQLREAEFQTRNRWRIIIYSKACFCYPFSTNKSLRGDGVYFTLIFCCQLDFSNGLFQVQVHTGDLFFHACHYISVINNLWCKQKNIDMWDRYYSSLIYLSYERIEH
jgi:hypothetical protein